jgi:hypothetical protein
MRRRMEWILLVSIVSAVGACGAGVDGPSPERSAAATDQQSILSERQQAPAGAPEWVHIPGGGAARRDCVHQIPKGARVDVATGDVEVGGARVAHFDECPEPVLRSAASDEAAREVASRIPSVSGWVEDANDRMDLASGRNITGIAADWYVPSAPSISEGQTVYLFDGITPDDKKEILQPVLSWGPSKTNNGWIGGPYWTIASWGIFPGNVYVSGPETVNTNDWIHGEITSTQNGGTMDWTIKTTDETSGAWTSQSIFTTGYQWNWGYGGVLEAYGINSCGDFPTDGVTSFFNVAITNNGGQPQGFVATTNWSGCGFGTYIYAEQTEVDLTY